MKFKRPSKLDVAINMAPLVDVVFLLVIFFAVSTTFLETAGLKLELPTSTSTADRKGRDLTIVLDSEGRTSFDGETLEPAALQERLREALADDEHKIVILRADTHTEHGKVVRLMDLIRDAGAVGLTVAAQQPAQSE